VRLAGHIVYDGDVAAPHLDVFRITALLTAMNITGIIAFPTFHTFDCVRGCCTLTGFLSVICDDSFMDPSGFVGLICK
jgi:hypothetical protein